MKWTDHLDDARRRFLNDMRPYLPPAPHDYSADVVDAVRPELAELRARAIDVCDT